ncbi:MAG: zinc dependent phospholipase C family protein [Chloroflexi bacterium]|nr:zinc dependent phospholipase C family protein [Chloroflexota bacterium]
MPTPFYHLALAEEMLNSPRLPRAICRLLNAERPAFLLGNVAPDVQTLSGQARESTHFFQVPLRDLLPAHRRLFTAWPALAHPDGLPPSQVAFLAGYICHLLLDQLWIREVFQPVFGPQASWEGFGERLYLHNVLRVYLDRSLLPRLPGNIAVCLRTAAPGDWLPFVTDRHLRAWRDFLADQLEPGAESRTVDVFARRMGREPAEFEALLDSPAELERRVFVRLSHDALDRFRLRGLAHSLQLVHTYLDSTSSEAPLSESRHEDH